MVDCPSSRYQEVVRDVGGLGRLNGVRVEGMWSALICHNSLVAAPVSADGNGVGSAPVIASLY